MRPKLRSSLAFVWLAFAATPLFAQHSSSVQTWPIRFKQASPSLMDVKYFQKSADDILTITASIEYLDNLKTSTPITAQHFWHSPFNWDMPRLSFKTENSTDNQILLEKVIIAVKASELDRSPIPIFIEDAIREVAFYNEGWGDLVGAKIEVGLLPESTCEGDTVVDRSDFRRIKTVKVGRVSAKYTVVEIKDLINSAFTGHRRACAVGVLTYTDENAGQWRVPFRAGVWLAEPRVGAPMPPNTTYDLYLPAGKSGYTAELPISQSVPAKGVDHFQVAVYSDKSATFDFAATVLSTRGQRIANSNVRLAYFRPRSASTPTTPMSKFKDVDVKLFDIRHLAPYVTSVRYDPLQPDSFVIQATEEWMLLPKGKRTAVHNQVESGLRKLGLPGASYCYLLKNECVRSGSFDWKL